MKYLKIINKIINIIRVFLIDMMIFGVLIIINKQ